MINAIDTEQNSICSCYEKDHDSLDRLFSEYVNHKYTNFQRAKENFAVFMHEAQRHMKCEEEILYPLFEQKTGIYDGPISIMKEDHRRINELLELIDQQIQNRHTSSERLENDLMMLVGLHSVNEENILYPVLDHLLTQDEKSDVFKRMKNATIDCTELCCFHD